MKFDILSVLVAEKLRKNEKELSHLNKKKR